MESFGFELKLVDSINQVAKQAAGNLRAVDSEAKKAAASLDKVFGQALGQIGKRAAQDSKDAAKAKLGFANSFAKIGERAAKDQAKAVAAASRAAAVAEKQQVNATKSQEKAVAAANRAAAVAAKHQASEITAAKKRSGYSIELANAEKQLNKLRADPAGYKKLLEVQRETAKLQKNMGKEGFFSGLKESMPFGRMVGAAALGTMLGEGLIEGAHKAVEFLVEGIKKAFEEAGHQQVLRLGEKLTLGAGAKDYREDVGRFSKMTGFDDDAIRGLLLPLRRAGFNQQSARSAFAIASDTAAGNGQGGNIGAVQETLSMLTNIKLKEGVNAKKLVGMGINAPEFFKSLGKSLGVSADVAEKRANDGGKVDPQLLINEIGKAVERKQGGKLGTGGLEYSKTFEARMAKIQNLPNEYLKAIVDAPGFEKLSGKIGSILEQLDPDGPKGQRIISSLLRSFDRLADIITAALTPEKIDRFADAVGEAVSSIDKLPALLSTVITASETIAAIWAGMKIVSLVNGVAAGLAGVGGTAAAAGGTGGAGAAVGTAVNAASKALGVGAGATGIALAAPFLLSGTDDPATQKNKEFFDQKANSGHYEGSWYNKHWVPDTSGPMPSGGGSSVSMPVSIEVHVNGTGADAHQQAGQEVGNIIADHAKQALHESGML